MACPDPGLFFSKANWGHSPRYRVVGKDVDFPMPKGKSTGTETEPATCVCMYTLYFQGTITCNSLDSLTLSYKLKAFKIMNTLKDLSKD